MGAFNGKKLGHGGLADATLLSPAPAADMLSLGLAETLSPARTRPLTLTPDSWKSAVSGNWATAADWSTGAAPTGSNDVTISVAGTYTVTVAAAAASNSVTINTAFAKINDTSSLTVATNLAVTAGQFIVNNTGTLVGGTVSVGTSGKFLAYNGATLSGITYQGTLAQQANATIYIENGITLTGVGGTGAGTISLAGGGEALNILDNETLNNATLSFGSGTNDYLYLNEASTTSTQSLTLGSGFVISQTGGSNIIGPYQENSGSIIDAGLISISGGTLIVGNGLGTFSDSGSIVISGGVFDLQTAMVESGSITTSGSGTFVLGEYSTLSGTINASSLNVQFGNYNPEYAGELVGATWQGALTVGASQSAVVAGGLTLTGANGSGAGTLNITGQSASVVVLDNETLNNATLNFGGKSDYLYLYEGSSTSTQALTLGSGFVVSQTTGTDLIDGYEGNPGALVNAGAINVSGGELVLGNGDIAQFTNSGQISVSAGELQLNGVAMTNTGSIAISGTGTLALYSQNLVLGTSGNTGALTTSGSGEVLLGEYSTLSGTINASSLNVQFGNYNPSYAGELVGATWQGALTVGASQSAVVTGGLTLTGANGSGAGTLNITGQSASVVVLDNETLNNATLNFGGKSDYLYLYEGSSTSTQALTLGSGFVVSQTTGTDLIDGYEGNPGALVNAGAINVSGGELVLGNGDIAQFTNSGQISVSAGELQLNGVAMTNTGSIAISGTGTLALYSQNLVLGTSGNTGALTTSGSGEVLLGEYSTLSGTINASSLNVQFGNYNPSYAGELVGATWQGALTVGASQSAVVTGGLTLTGANGSGAGTLNITGQSASVVVLDNETLNNATLNFGGKSDYLYLYEGSSTSTQALTLGSGFVVSQTTGTDLIDGYEGNPGALVNAGAINVSGGELVLGNGDIAQFTNSGQISVSAGELQLNGVAMTNTGSIAISGTGTLALYSQNLVLGTSGNTGALTTSGSGEVLLGEYSTLSGTINGSSLNVQFGNYNPSYAGELVGATWQGALTVGASQSAVVAGGLTLTGANGSGAGTLNITGQSASVVVLDNETLNNATLNFGGKSDYLYLYEGSSTSAQTLTLGSGFVVSQTTGTDLIDGYEGNPGALVNAGSINVSGGDLLIGNGDIAQFTNSGQISVTAGELQLEGFVLTNTGSIAISGTGTLDLNAQNLTLGTGGNSGALTTSGNGELLLGESSTLSGTINASSLNVQFGNYDPSYSGELVGATWQGALTVGASQSAVVTGGLTLTGANGSGAGTLNITGQSASVVVLDNETLNNATLNFGGKSDYLYLYEGSSTSTQTLTLGSGFAVSQTTRTDYIEGYEGNPGALVNAGLISVSGGELIVTGITSLTNSGTMAISGAGSLDISGVTKFSSLSAGALSGNYSLAGGSVLELVNNASVTTLAGTVTLAGAGSSIQSYNTTSGAQITLDSKLATVAAGGLLSIGAGRSFSAANAFTDSGTVTLAGGGFTEKSLTVAAGALFSGSGSVTGTLVDNGTITASGGLLKLASSLTGTGALQISAGATLEAGAATTAQETVSFAASGAKLKIDTPISFASILANYAPGDVIDLANTAVTSVSSTGTTIAAVTAGGTITLTLSAPLAGEHLGLTRDGASGTNITAYGLAQSSIHAPEPVAFGNHHVGDNVSTALTLTNTAAANGFSEALDAALGSATGAASATGSFAQLAAGQSNSTSLVIGLNTATAGALTGTAVITENSDGTGIDGFGQTSLGTQLVNVSGAVYAYAQATEANGGTVTLANTHVGQAASGFLGLTNSAANTGYSEALDATLGGAASGFSASGSIAGLLAQGSNTSALSVGYTSSASGAYAGTASLALVSDGTAIGDGLGTTTLAGQSVTITGAAYAYAVGTLASSTINLGIVHVGQADSAALMLTNSALANGYAEALDAGLSGATAGITASGSLSGLAAGSTDSSSLLVGLTTSASGSFSGTALLGLVSDGTNIDGLGTTTLAGQTITISGTVDNYAQAAFQDPGGPASAGAGTQYAINLGSVAQGSAADILALGVLNTATGLSDLLQGTISSAGGAGFTNSGFGAFSGFGAGQGEHSQSVTLSTSNAGTFTETIILSSAGTNASGYNGALATETLTITGIVTPVGSTTYTLSAGPNSIVGANGGDVFIAPTYSLNSRDSLTGGTGANVMQLSGGGLFDLGAPTVFANIPTITAYEGQLASGAVANTQQVVFLRDGSNENLSVVAGTAAKGNANAESIVIYSSNATNAITLASGADSVILAHGTDTVVLGGIKNTVAAGGGTALVQATAAFASASVVGAATGSTTLEITSAGTVTLNAADTYLTVKLDGATKLTLSKLAFITANGANGHDTLIAGAANQTLIGGTADVLTGFTGGGDLFTGASAALTGDSIGNWITGDTIDLTDMSPSAKLTYTGNTTKGTLTISDGTHKSVLSFSGNFTAANFAAPVTDGHGGALIAYQT